MNKRKRTAESNLFKIQTRNSIRAGAINGSAAQMYSEGHLLILLLLVYLRFMKNLLSKHRLFFMLNLVELQRKVRWVGHVVCMGEKRNVYRVLVGKPVG